MRVALLLVAFSGMLLASCSKHSCEAYGKSKSYKKMSANSKPSSEPRI
jgi:hypothetical protein